jgi:hypothetical protein
VEQAWQDAAQDYILSLDGLLEKNGCRAEKKTGADIERCDAIMSYYKNERALSKIEFLTGTTNIFSWPSATQGSITAFFRDNGYYQSLGSHHDAIDIALPQ